MIQCILHTAQWHQCHHWIILLFVIIYNKALFNLGVWPVRNCEYISMANKLIIFNRCIWMVVVSFWTPALERFICGNSQLQFQNHLVIMENILHERSITPRLIWVDVCIYHNAQLLQNTANRTVLDEYKNQNQSELWIIHLMQNYILSEWAHL